MIDGALLPVRSKMFKTNGSTLFPFFIWKAETGLNKKKERKKAKASSRELDIRRLNYWQDTHTMKR
ncbi:hypothetical protein BLOT_011254 [Blomia tropicalis]|nr:hypothetical protein BLOT_011254 [Blomia tropicalis]